MCNLFILDPVWVSAIAAVIYATFSGWIIWEMRKDRKLSWKPIVKGNLKDARFPKWLLIGVKNVGRGPALVSAIECTPDEGAAFAIKESVLPFAIGSNESLEVKFESPSEYEIGGEEIHLVIEYSDIFNKHYKDKILILKIEDVINNFPLS